MGVKLEQRQRRGVRAQVLATLHAGRMGSYQPMLRRAPPHLEPLTPATAHHLLPRALLLESYRKPLDKKEKTKNLVPRIITQCWISVLQDSERICGIPGIQRCRNPTAHCGIPAFLHEVHRAPCLSTKRVIGLIGTEKSCPMIVGINSNSFTDRHDPQPVVVW